MLNVDELSLGILARGLGSMDAPLPVTQRARRNRKSRGKGLRKTTGW